MMHSFRSNADHTRLISKSIFITNFPDSTTSKDLWNLCQPYGTVVDVFIPNRKSKSGKRFAFIRFIKVDNIDRLVGNLCTLWIGRFHLHANVVRFDRPPKYASRSSHPVNPKPANHVSPVATSFVSAVKGNSSPFVSKPALVLDESCLVTRDLGYFVMGEVLQFSSINNLRVILSNEGFPNAHIVYLGGLGSKAKKDWIRELITKHKVSFLFIQETKMELISAMDVKQLWGNYIFDHSFSEALGNSGVSSMFTPDKSTNVINEKEVSDAAKVRSNSKSDGGLGSKAKKDWIRELITKHKVSFLSIQETKMELISAMDVKQLWGNYIFDHSFSEALGNSGGILCTWDSSIFHKEHHIISDNFVALYGTWIPNQLKLLVISVYAPQSLSSKQMLWSYISSLIVLGMAMSWSWRYSMKVSVRSGMDVRGPILLRECISDFGAIPFRFYHSWFGLPGFDQMVIDSWNSLVLDDNNVYETLARFSNLRSSWITSKGKICWAIEGDENSKFFHAILVKTCQSFCQRFPDLESPISRNEIRLAVWGCVEDKSTGPDGFTFEFFRKFWKVVGPDFCIAVEWFFEHGSFAIGCNSSFVALIPKILIPINRNQLSFPTGRSSMVLLSLVSYYLGANLNIIKRWFLRSISPRPTILLGGSFGSIFVYSYNGISSSIFSRAVEAGIFTGIEIGSSLMISHLFYADDAVFIGEWSHNNLKGIMNILRCFSLLSGLSINVKKSQLLGIGISYSIVFEAAKSLGCSIMKTPFKYLGIPVGGNMSLIKAWDESIVKLKRRLSKWKLKTLSIGGRLTLLKSVLGSTPIYNMSLFKVPKSVLHSMESLRRNFFNGIQEGDKKIAWVKWPMVLASKKHGGLGVSSFYALNRGLLFKWVWRYISQDNSLWARVISALHGSSSQVLSASFSSLWKSILNEVKSLKAQGVDLISHCKIRVGNGMNTSFWNDCWIGDSMLKHLFPRLFALETIKDISVADKFRVPITCSFRRPVRGGLEAQQLDHLMGLIESTLLSNSEDRWVWDLNGDGVFRVKDVRNLLDETFLPKADTPTRWIKCIPIKVNVFVWKALQDRLPTRSNLVRRNILIDSLSCPICDGEPEDSSHLFFRCCLARDVTRLVCRWWDLDFHSFNSYTDWQGWFKQLRLGVKSKEVLEGVFTSLGGVYGISGINSFLRILILVKMLFSMRLSYGRLIGV
ncbi:RNA-directed DNA polymerase, eukaryota [Tanacetum coccineum]